MVRYQDYGRSQPPRHDRRAPVHVGGLLVLVFALLAWPHSLVARAASPAASPYGASTHQFTPDGRILQITYAKEAVRKHGGPVAGCRCVDGVVLVCGRRCGRAADKFMVRPPTKVFAVDGHVCVAAAGLLFDAKAVADIARRLCLKHRATFEDPMPVEMLSEELATVLHRQTVGGGGRPLGVGLLVAGWDATALGPQLYQVDAEGGLSAWKAVCVGHKGDKIMDTLAALERGVWEEDEGSGSGGGSGGGGGGQDGASKKLRPAPTVAEATRRLMAAMRAHLPAPPGATGGDGGDGGDGGEGGDGAAKTEAEEDGDWWELDIHTVLLPSARLAAAAGRD